VNLKLCITSECTIVYQTFVLLATAAAVAAPILRSCGSSFRSRRCTAAAGSAPWCGGWTRRPATAPSTSCECNAFGGCSCRGGKAEADSSSSIMGPMFLQPYPLVDGQFFFNDYVR